MGEGHLRLGFLMKAHRIFDRYLRRPWEILIRTPGRWIRGRHLAPGLVAVFFGYERIPGRDEHTGGGMVKYQDLNDVFPNARDRANRLYLVSSAYPWTVRWQVWWAQVCGAKVILNQNGVAYPGWFGRGYERENRRAAWVHRRADYVVYQSQFCRESAVRYLGRRDRDWEVCMNPVDTKVFSPVKVGSLNGVLRLLIAGSHQFAYRIESALDAVRELRDRGQSVRLVIAGRLTFDPDPGRAESQLQKWIEERGLGAMVDWLGPYRQSEAPELLRSCDILLHPKYNDPCPRLVAEALACGLPVVYSASGGVPEMVGEGAGIGVVTEASWERDYPPDGRGLAEAVEVIAEDLAGYARRARERAVARLDTTAWIVRHRDIFSSVGME